MGIPIRVDEMKFARQPSFSTATTLALLLLATGTSGCSTSESLSTAAPRSAVSRDEAVNAAETLANNIGGQVYAVAPTGSMIPTLDEGSIVTVEKVPLSRLQKGDIVIYRNAAGTPVIHRLFERHGNRWFVLGDGNAAIDRETVSAGNFLGRVCAIFYTSASNSFANRAGHAPRATTLADGY